MILESTICKYGNLFASPGRNIVGSGEPFTSTFGRCKSKLYIIFFPANV